MAKLNKAKLSKLMTLEEFERKHFTADEIAESHEKARYISLIMKMREFRIQLGYSQQELAKLSGVPRPTISKIESGRRNATLETLMRICKPLGKELVIDFK